MSYCRWSSDSYRCDLYCYEDVDGGFTIHIAATRCLVPDGVGDGIDDLRSGMTDDEIREWSARYQGFLRDLERYEWVEIDLPHAGESFNEPDLVSFRDRLVYLRNLGYQFPDHVFEMIDEDLSDVRES